MSTPRYARVLCRLPFQSGITAGGWIASITKAYLYLGELRSCDPYTPYWIEHDTDPHTSGPFVYSWMLHTSPWPRPYPAAINEAWPREAAVTRNDDEPDADFERRVQEEVQRRLAARRQTTETPSATEPTVPQLADDPRQRALETLVDLMTSMSIPATAVAASLVSLSAPPSQNNEPVTRRPKPTTRPTPKPRVDPPPSPAPTTPRRRQIMED